MRHLLLLLLFVCGSASALSRTEVESWPVIYRAAPGEDKPAPQTFTAAEAALLGQIASGANARPAMKTVRQNYASSGVRPLGVGDVLFSLVAPYRSAENERLTVFKVLGGEPPILLAVLSSERGSSGWLIEPRANMLICSTREGYTLRDINADGRREFAWVYSCGDGPGSSSVLSLFDWRGGELRQFAEMTAMSEGPFTDSEDRIAEASTVHVRKGPNPQIVSVVDQRIFDLSFAGDRPSTALRSRKTLLRPVGPLPKDAPYAVRRLW